MLLHLAKRINGLSKFHSSFLITTASSHSNRMSAKIPKLEVPNLEVSLSHFLISIKQLIDEKSYLEIVRMTELFRINEGPFLQNKLISFSRESENWASEFWVDSRFLSNRISLLFTNSIITIKKQFDWRTIDEMLLPVSVLVQHIMDTVVGIRNGKFPPEMIGGIPLCMRQYERITAVHRLPGINTDQHKCSKNSRHIVVLHRGNIYKMPVYTSDNRVVSLHEAFHLLREVVRLSRESAVPMGLLTADNRDAWFSFRQELMKSSVNSSSLKAIEESLFGICLDESIPPNGIIASKECRFGGPPGDFHTFNRWFDLGFQVVFSQNGYFSWMIEHSILDGGILVDIFAKLQLSNLKMDIRPTIVDESLKIEQLKWDISGKIQSRIEGLKFQISDWYSKYDSYPLEYEVYGKKLLKEHKIYSLGFFHLAIQLAYFKMHGKFTSTFFPVSLRRFSDGRLEHPHTLSRESVLFVEAMLTSNASATEKWELMKKAIFRFKEILTESIEGEVYLKHILALKKLAEREKISVDLFENPNFDVFGSPKLGFSTLFFPEPITSNYPTDKPNNFYLLFDFSPNSISFSVTKMHDLPGSITSKEFAGEIRSSLNVLYQLILSQTVLKSNL